MSFEERKPNQERAEDFTEVPDDTADFMSIPITSSIETGKTGFDPESIDDLVKVENIVIQYEETHNAFLKGFDDEAYPDGLKELVTAHQNNIAKAKDLVSVQRTILEDFDTGNGEVNEAAEINAENLAEQLAIIDASEEALDRATGGSPVEVDDAPKSTLVEDAPEAKSETQEQDRVSLAEEAKELLDEVKARFGADGSDHMPVQNDLVRKAFVNAYQRYENRLNTDESATEDELRNDLEKLRKMVNLLPADEPGSWDKVKEKEEVARVEQRRKDMEAMRRRLRRGELAWPKQTEEPVENDESPESEKETDDVLELREEDIIETDTNLATASEGKVAEEVMEGQSLAEEVGELPEQNQEKGYADIREGWRAAKEAHEQLSKEYETAVAEHYEQVKSNTSLLGRFKVTFGFKPKATDEMSPEVSAKRSELFAATAEYNKWSRAMMQARELAGKKRIMQFGKTGNTIISEEQQEQLQDQENKKQAALERYQRLLARATIVNTLDNERAVQEAAADKLAIKPPRFLQNKYAKYVGAAVIGGGTAFLTGGGSMLAGAGQSIARVFGAGVISADVAKRINDGTEARIEGLTGRRNEKDLWNGSELEREISLIADRLVQKETTNNLENTVTAEELQEMHDRLYQIYDQVDKEQQKRIRNILATAVASGVVLGAGIDTAIDAFADTAAAAAPANVFEAQSAAVPEAGASETGAETVGETMYTVEPGFTVWDYFEGETGAPKPEIMDSVPAEQQQAFIKQIEIALNNNPDLLADIGLGESAHDLSAGAEINLALLDQVAADVAANDFAATVEVAETEVAPAPPEQSAELEQSEVAAQVETMIEDIQESTEQAGVEEVSGATEVTIDNQATEVIPEGSTNEALEARYGANPATVYEYIVSYEGGAAAFLKEFNEAFVAEHQSHHLDRGGFLGLGGSQYSEAFAYMKGMTIGEIQAIGTEGSESVDEFLDKTGIHEEDFNNWREQIAVAEKSSDMTFAQTDRLEETMQALYIQTSNA